MVAAMNPIRWQKRPSPLAVIFCLVLTVALSATSLLAAVNTLAACDRQCCCYAAPRHGSVPTIGSAADSDAGCCNPTGLSPCNMSAAELPTSSPALVQTTGQASDQSGHAWLAAGKLSLPLQSHLAPVPWAPITHVHDTLPVYLKTCRLIC